MQGKGRDIAFERLEIELLSGTHGVGVRKSGLIDQDRGRLEQWSGLSLTVKMYIKKMLSVATLGLGGRRDLCLLCVRRGSGDSKKNLVNQVKNSKR